MLNIVESRVLVHYAKRTSMQTTGEIVISAMYKFVSLPDYEAIQQPLKDFMKANNILGTLLLAHEGINGTVSGCQTAIDALYQWLGNYPGLDNIVHKESYHHQQPFNRTKVKLKKEIVTMGVENIDPNHVVGTYIDPQDWNKLISDPDVVVVDTRNDYEYEIGTFKGALNPNTQTFREFPQYTQENLDPEKHKKVAMFCTGGIRCEKSTAYLKQQGFDEVYHLKGGILKYLEEVPKENSLWEGDCFVFDERVAVDHDLQKSKFDQCHACRYPITEEDKQSEFYQQGVSCPRCHHLLTDKQKQRFAEREKQSQLAKLRGEQHIGGTVQETNAIRRQQKYAVREAQKKNV